MMVCVVRFGVYVLQRAIFILPVGDWSSVTVGLNALSARRCGDALLIATGCHSGC